MEGNRSLSLSAPPMDRVGTSLVHTQYVYVCDVDLQLHFYLAELKFPEQALGILTLCRVGIDVNLHCINFSMQFQ